MYLLIEDNSNCAGDERVFSTLDDAKNVHRINTTSPTGEEDWFEITGVDENGGFVTAQAIQVEDSGEGRAWLIYGGLWGLRLKPNGDTRPWSLDDDRQWGVPFKVLDISGDDISFDESP